MCQSPCNAPSGKVPDTRSMTGSLSPQAVDHHDFITISARRVLGLISETTIESLNSLKTNGGSVCESNTPATSKMPPAGFEDRDDHRTACASSTSRQEVVRFSPLRRYVLAGMPSNQSIRHEL